MTKKQYQNATGIFSTQLAIISYVIGTIIFLSYIFSNNSKLIDVGLFYIGIALIINFIMLIWLIYLLITQKNHREYFVIKILILLANIPIAIFYFYLIIQNITSNSPF
jgi:hypothetical protein